MEISSELELLPFSEIETRSGSKSIEALLSALKSRALFGLSSIARQIAIGPLQKPIISSLTPTYNRLNSFQLSRCVLEDKWPRQTSDVRNEEHFALKRMTLCSKSSKCTTTWHRTFGPTAEEFLVLNGEMFCRHPLYLIRWISAYQRSQIQHFRNKRERIFKFTITNKVWKYVWTSELLPCVEIDGELDAPCRHFSRDGNSEILGESIIELSSISLSVCAQLNMWQCQNCKTTYHPSLAAPVLTLASIIRGRVANAALWGWS